MKYFVVLFVAIATTSALNVNPEVKEKLMKIISDCMQESGVAEEVVAKALAGEFTDDPKLEAQVLCFAKKTEMINDAGDVNVEMIKSRVHMVISDEAKANEFITRCTVQKASPAETAMSIIKCFHEIMGY